MSLPAEQHAARKLKRKLFAARRVAAVELANERQPGAFGECLGDESGNFPSDGKGAWRGHGCVEERPRSQLGAPQRLRGRGAERRKLDFAVQAHQTRAE